MSRVPDGSAMQSQAGSRAGAVPLLAQPQPEAPSVLVRSAALSFGSTAALASQVRPAIVLPERETRQLLQAAARNDVRSGGRFCTNPAGIQVWSSAWDGPSGTPGSAVHLGSVDWTYDTPVRHYATIYRAMVTSAGVAAGESTASVLARVLALTGIPMDSQRVTLPEPPGRDPFRSRS